MNDNITEINKDTFWALIQEANAQFSIEDGPDSSFHYPTSAPGNDVQQVFFGIRHQF